MHQLLIIHFFIDNLLFSKFIQACHTDGAIWTKNNIFVVCDGVSDSFFKLFFYFHTVSDHAVVQLVDQITESFENKKDTLGVFIDLSKAFDNVDQSILLKKIGAIWCNGQKSWMGQKLPLR